MCLKYGKSKPKRAYKAHAYKARAYKARPYKARAYKKNVAVILNFCCVNVSSHTLSSFYKDTVYKDIRLGCGQKLMTS